MDNISLLINFRAGAVAVKLTRNGEDLDMLMVPLDIHFDTMLVTSIDKILKRNRIEPLSICLVKVGGRVNKSSVAYMMAQAIAAALKASK